MITLNPVFQEGESSRSTNQLMPSEAGSTAGAVAAHQVGRMDNTVVLTHKGNDICGADQFYAIPISAGEQHLSTDAIWERLPVYCLSKSKQHK